MKFNFPEVANAVNQHPTSLRGTPRIRQNVWGNWNGYIGSRKVYEIGSSEFDAKVWLEEQTSPTTKEI